MIGRQYKENFRSLNPEQKEAVMLPVNRASLILAGAGSGKTQVLTMRLCRLYYEENIPLSRMMAVTFTKKAAKEMQERMEKMGIDKYSLNTMYMGTFHALCARILRDNWETAGLPKNFKILDDEDSMRYLRNIATKMGVEKGLLNSLSSYLSMWKENNVLELRSNKIRLDRFDSDIKTSMFRAVCKEYQDKLFGLNRLDFDDLMVCCYKLFRDYPDVLKSYQNSFDIVLVDEFQDTSEFQYEWLKLLTFDKKNLFAVGDDDQSIYAFRNANVRNIQMMFHEYSAQRVKLERNYRSAKDIITHSNELIKFNGKSRMGKTLVAQKAEKGFVHAYQFQSDIDMAEWICDTIQKLIADGYDYRDIVCLYRSRSAIEAVSDEFEKQKLPFHIQNQIPFYKRSEIKDAIHYMELAAVLNNAVAFERVCNIPARGFGDASLQKLVDFYRENKKRESFDQNIMAHLNEDVLSLLGLRTDVRKKMVDFAQKMMLCNRILSRADEFWSEENQCSWNDLDEKDEARIQHILKQKNLMIENIEDVVNTLGKEVFDKNEYSHQENYIRYDKSGNSLDVPCIHWVMWVYRMIQDTMGLSHHHNERISKILKNKQGDIDMDEFVNRKSKLEQSITRFEFFLKQCFTTFEMFNQFDEWVIHAEQEEEQKNLVRLMTIHGSKGLEFPVVILVGCSEKILPSFFAQQEEDIEEERRLMYVGMTRAKEMLYLTSADFYSKTNRSAKLSRFVSEGKVKVTHHQPKKMTIQQGRAGLGW